MTPERWQRITALFDAALERAPVDRAAFLDDACRGDEDLRREVESLLVSHQRAHGFMDAPAFETGAGFQANDTPVSVEGRRIGPYIVQHILGHGGMGVVFLAKDTRLGRMVALKALPPPFALDDRRRERLRLEARAAASLSHPGIATVYALEQVGSDIYIAFEYVRGETLRAELDRGPLPIDRLIGTIRQLARALAAAHAAGIVHRDLKPENVMRCADGTVKILDFGLAQLDIPGVEAASVTRLTGSGTVLGTPAYMSPEQLEARPVDSRTDIFALGVMIYEMACGAHPYQGRTPASTIARIMDADPQPLSPRMPVELPGLEHLVGRCLRKDPAARYRSADDLAADLNGLDRGAGILATRETTSTPERTESVVTWWRIHQMTVMVVYAVVGVAMWMVKSWVPGLAGIVLFVWYVASAALNGTIRAHLLFTQVHNARAMGDELGRTSAIKSWSDWGVAASLIIGAVPVAADHLTLAALLVAVGVGSAAAFTIIEPATTRAAFPDRQ